MELNKLIQIVRAYTETLEAEKVLARAFQIASTVHDRFQRINREPFISHPLAVAGILAEWHAPVFVVAAGMLHDILSPDYSRERDLVYFESKLEPEIFRLLKTVTEINSYLRDVEGGDFHSEAEANDFWYRMTSFLQEEQDAVVIKIADRLHNVQTISALTQYFQERTAGIALHLLSPLANRLGMRNVKRQFEDCCFEINNPSFYNLIKQHCANAKIHQKVGDILEELRQISSKLMPLSEIRWQPASLLEIGQNVKPVKAIHGDPAPINMADIGSFIILVGEESQCYSALGVIHKLYSPVKGQFEDFIANPKENGYRSLHTCVKHPFGNILHVSIRTHAMDLVAEYGITARWWNVPYNLLPELPKEIEPVDGKMEVLTPNGEKKYLPPGATVLDFAYLIHTDVGNRCVGALVNGKQAELNRPLQNGDRIEIILGEPGVGPEVDWLGYVQTLKAMNRIRQGLAVYKRDDMVERGRMLLEAELHLLGLDSTDVQIHRLLARLAAKENLKGIEALLISMGTGRHNASKIVESLKSMLLKSARSQEYVEPILDVIVLSTQKAQLQRVFARCCRPQPPDDIVGYHRNDEILAIHKRTCSQINELERFTPVKWSTMPIEPNYIIVVDATNRRGLASDISTAVTMLGIDMENFTSYKRPDGVTAEARIHLGKSTIAQRNRIQRALEVIPCINSVEVTHSSFFSASSPLKEFRSTGLMPNPYGPGLAEGPRFYGREIESERISILLQDGSRSAAVLLWGQKRIGKTSFVLRLRERSRGSFLPIYLDMQGLRDGSTTEFLHRLMSNISQALCDNRPNLKQEISTPQFHRLRKDPLTYFDTFMAQLQEYVQSPPLVVILDEFQCLCSLREELVSRSAIFSRLRSLSQHQPSLHFVLSGGGLMNQLTNQCDIDSLFTITHNEKLSCLSEKAARRLIKDGLTKIGGITELASDLLLDQTGGHPFYLQLLCSRLYEQAQENKTMITQQFVSQCIQEWLQTVNKNRFQHLWEGYDTTSGQRNKLILSAVAQFGNNEVEYDRLASTLCSTISQQVLLQSLEDLTDLGVLRRNQLYFAIEVNLFARWLRLHWPLELTLKETGEL